jgi:competence protein ComEC
MSGILIAYFFLPENLGINRSYSMILQILLAVLLIIIIIKLNVSFLFYLFIVLLTISLGVIRFNYVYMFYSGHSVSQRIENMKGKTIKLYGYLIEQPDENEDRMKLIINSDSISLLSKTIAVDGKVMISIFKNKYSAQRSKRLEYGDYVEVTGNLEALPHRRNPGEFDYGEYLKLHDIEASFTSFGFDKINCIGSTSPDFYKKNIIYPVKKYSLKKIDEYMGGDEGEFMKGLVLGDRSNISKEIRESFVNDGISHIIAVSGLNVVYVLIIISIFLQLFSINNLYKTLIMVVTLLFYMNLTGNTPSIIRATVMACVYMLSLHVERKTISVNIVSFAALIILIIDPRQLFDAGFILSFWAILSLVIIYPRLENIIKEQKVFVNIQDNSLFNNMVKAILMLILGTIAAQIGTIPITAIMFKKISLVSFVTNMVAIPVSNFAMAIGFLMIMVSLISSWAASAIALSGSFVLNILLKFIDFFAKLSFSYIETYRMDIIFLVCFYLIVIVLLFIPHLKIIPKILILLLIVLNHFTIESIVNKNDKLSLSYLDVGNSNACVISTPSDFTIGINSGTSTTKYSSAENNVIPYLKLKGKSCLDLLIITDLNKDEFRNLLNLEKSFQIFRLIIPEGYKSIVEDDYFSNVFKGTKIEYINKYEIICLTDSLKFVIMPVNSGNNSFVCSMIYGKQQFMFTDFSPGDSCDVSKLIPVENTASAVLKVPYSGSFNLISAESIAVIDPKYIVISSRRDYKRLNTDIFISSLENLGIKVLKTSQNGAVIFETDGKRTELVNWK